MQSHKKCPNCQTINLNRDYCEECGALINVILQRKLDHQVKLARQRVENRNRKPNAAITFFKKAKEHPNFLVRLMAKAFYSVWVIVLVIGGILALVFAYFAA